MSLVLFLALLGALQVTRHWAKTWTLIPLLAFVGPVYSVREGVSLVGLDVTLIPLMLLAARRGRVSSSLGVACASLLAASLVTALFSHADTPEILTALKISVISVLGSVAAYKSVREDSTSKKWFLTGLMGLQVLSLLSLGSIYSSWGVPLTGPADLIKVNLVLPFGGSNYVASIAVLIVGASVVLTREMGSSRIPWLICTWGLSLGVVFLSDSKWGMASLLLVSAISVVSLAISDGRKGYRWVAVSVLVVTTLILFVSRWSLWGVWAQVSAQGMNLSAYSTGVTRVEIWRIYLQSFYENPLIGRGLGWRASHDGLQILAHNTALELLGQGGLLLFLTFLGLAMALVIRSVHENGVLALPLIGAGVLSGLLEVTLRSGWYDLLLFVALGLSTFTLSRSSIETVASSDRQIRR